MYTSDIDMTRKKYAKKSVVYLFISLFCILFGAVYELYSHEVYSYHMIYAFVFPLVGGTLLFSILGLIKIRICSGTFARNFYHSGVATLTVGSIVQGILDIYGTTNMLTCWYWRIGLLFIILSIVLTLLARRAIMKSCDSL